jgi:DNA-binding NarL/FixJ family response regulator
MILAKQLRVLIADESGAFLASTVRWIEARADLRLVGTARTSTDALEAVDRLRPDLVILEAVLHEIDGFQLARALKARKNPPLVVLVTFHANAAVREEALASGADGFLAKSDFSDSFEALLDEWKGLAAERATERALEPPAPLTTPERSVLPGSRTVPDP